jgi:tripartite-type tricarboxylate transporter receptor subunit TctC
MTDNRAVTGQRPRLAWQRLGTLVWSLWALLAAAPSPAQDYPSRPIRVIVPFSPGGAVDGPTRIVAQELTRRLGQQVVVENRPGAGATIGSEAVAKAAPDGYTLLLASQTNAISATLYSKLSFSPIDDFAPISLIGREPAVLVVHPSLPVKTVKELLDLARSQPGQLDYASSGNGSGQHLFAAQLFSMAGVTLNHVPYRGSGQATTDLIAGVVKVSVPGLAGMLPHIRSGKLRPLATTGAQRAPQLPDVPTLAESGFPGHSAYVWLGLLAPRGTPAPIVEQLNREVLAALGTPEVKDYMGNASIDVFGSTPAEFGAFFRTERDTWGRVIQSIGVKVD